MRFEYPVGATPLDLNETHGLIPNHISTQEELNAWEENNILQAQEWAFKQKNVLTLVFIQKLHLRMFDKTWKWAGTFRTSEKNIGVSWMHVPTKIQELCLDIQYQIEHATFSKDEIAIRFHHRLVYIHPFPNGNGRHARLMADILITQEGNSRFSWGMHQTLSKTTPVRKQYIHALQCADRGDYSPLLAFARS